ncbi:MAG TPA: YihY/virulence factor BrkB family protein [Candidatus Limnocylindrales bacterium]|nr:YihY/virulence factor BrkB family protein [Candidatus Limnocylindrales bacterium]
MRRILARVLALPPVVTARAVLDSFNAAGGGLLAGGLAYAALFALLPGLLLVTGLLGVFVTDPTRQQAAVDAIGRAFPPLESIAGQTLAQVSAGAVPVSALGLAGLAWGASRFYGSLDDAFARIFRNAPARGLVARIGRGLLAVVFLTVVFIGGVALTGIASAFVDEQPFGLAIPLDVREVWRFVGPAVAAVVFVAGVGIVYRLVPDREVTLGALWLPALVVGVVLAAFTQLFTFVAPRLIGVAAIYGSLAAIFSVMVWLGTTFQVLLVGAAWVRVRLDEGAAPPVAP